MANDKSNGSQSRSRRFARGLFSSSSSKDANTNPTWLAPRTNSLVPVVQSQSRPRTPVEKPRNSRIPSPIPEDPPEEEEAEVTAQVAAAAPPTAAPPTATVTKRLSRQSLFELFSKPKVEKARGHHENVQTNLQPVPERSQTPLPMKTEPPVSRRRQVKSAQIDLSPVKEFKQVAQPQEPLVRSSSRLSLRPSKQNLVAESTESQNDIATKPQDSWAPPPLFQAYPQAAKHAKLQSVSSSTEAYLKSQQLKRNLAMEASGSNTHLAMPFYEAKDQPSREPAKLKRHSMMDSPDLVDKIFVLVTAGRLLQYGTSGYSDRSPEKILTLGPQSAAYACDLVPGKHFVVQVVQNTEDVNQSALRPQRSLMNRLKATGTISGRKHINSILLIFTSAAEMDIWIKTIRRMIEQVGGKPRGADPEIARTKEQELRQQQRLQQLPSHRFLVQRDSQRFTDDRRDSISPVMPPAQLPKSSPNDVKRLSFLASNDSVATTTASSPGSGPLLEQDMLAIASQPRRLSPTNLAATAPPMGVVDRSFSPDLLQLDPIKETSRFNSTSLRPRYADSGRVSPAPLRTSPPRRTEMLPEKSFARFGPLRPVSSNPAPTIASRRRSAQADFSASTAPPVSQHVNTSGNALPSINRPSAANEEKALRPLKTMSLIPEAVDQVQLPPRRRPVPASDAAAPAPSASIAHDPAANNSARNSINFSTPGHAPAVQNMPPSRIQSSIGNVSVQPVRGKDGRVFSDPIHTAPRARPFFRPLPVRPAQGGDGATQKPSPKRSESTRSRPTPRQSNSEPVSGLPRSLTVDEHIRKVLQERMYEERLMMEKSRIEDQQSKEDTKTDAWQVQVTEEIITEVTVMEPETPEQTIVEASMTNSIAASLPPVEDKTLSNILEVETFEEGILDLNSIEDRIQMVPASDRPTTPKLKRASVQDLLSMKEPSPERPVQSIQQRSRADPMHYSQANARSAILAKRIASEPLQNPPSMPLPAPPPSHMPSLSTRPSSRNAFAPPPATGIRPGRRTPSVHSVSRAPTLSSRSTSPVNTHSRQSSSVHRKPAPTSSPKAELEQKLRRPVSMQISTDHAPFLAARRTGSVSQNSSIDQTAQHDQSRTFAGAPTLGRDYRSSSMADIRETANEHAHGVAPNAGPHFQAHMQARLQQSSTERYGVTNSAFSSTYDLSNKHAPVDPFVMDTVSLRAVSPLLPQTSNSSSRAPSSQVSPSLDTSARSTSPTNSDHSDSVILEIGSPIRRMSSPRLSYIGPPSASFRNLSPPPVPPMNPNRLAVKNHLNTPMLIPSVSSVSSISSMSSVAIADLPPPVPPPSCPLPDVPRPGRF